MIWVVGILVPFAAIGMAAVYWTVADYYSARQRLLRWYRRQ